MLTDEQCNEFRQHPGSFNEMVRHIYRTALEEAAKLAEKQCGTMAGAFAAKEIRALKETKG